MDPSLLGPLAAASGTGLTAYSLFRLNRKALALEIHRKGSPSPGCLAYTLRVINVGRMEMRVEDLAGLIEVSIPAGRLICTNLELRTTNGQPNRTVHFEQPQATAITVAGLALNPNDTLVCDLSAQDCRNPPELFMQVQGFKWRKPKLFLD